MTSSVITALAVPKGIGNLFSKKRPSTQEPEPPFESRNPGAATCDGFARSTPAHRGEDDLRDLNTALRVLAEIFPDIQPEVFREMLCSFGEESRLHVVTDSLLKQKATWVRRRYRDPRAPEPGSRRVKGQDNVPASRRRLLQPEDEFRSDSYKSTVITRLSQEFKGLSPSTVRAVLAEHNYSYTHTRPALLNLTHKSWRYSVISFFTRQKRPSATNHPLLTWKKPESTPNGPLLPAVNPTGSAELDEEIYNSLVAPYLAKLDAEQQEHDRILANKINEAEAEEGGALYDCECCFTASTFECVAACDERGHFICHRCIRHSLNEALYGQGWVRNVDTERSTLRCIAPAMDEQSECEGCIPQNLVKGALLCDGTAAGREAWRQFEDRAAGECVLKSQLPLLKCPFCVYAEVDDIHMPGSMSGWRIRHDALFPILVTTLYLHFYFDTLRFGLNFLAILFSILLLLLALPSLRPRLLGPFNRSRNRVARKRRGLRFECRNPECGRASCVSCSKEWQDIHICFESERLALRSAIERAMAEAVKRTCPNCNMSFIKSSGCNKLTCVCGYQMCYVCRKEVGKESYAHFCQHFRPDPGLACTECDKCDLYKTEDEDTAIQRAAEEAEREWKQKEGIGSAWAGQQIGTKSRMRNDSDDLSGVLGWALKSGFWASSEYILDCLMEILFVEG